MLSRGEICLLPPSLGASYAGACSVSADRFAFLREKVRRDRSPRGHQRCGVAIPRTVTGYPGEARGILKWYPGWMPGIFGVPREARGFQNGTRDRCRGFLGYPGEARGFQNGTRDTEMPRTRIFWVPGIDAGDFGMEIRSWAGALVFWISSQGTQGRSLANDGSGERWPSSLSLPSAGHSEAGTRMAVHVLNSVPELSSLISTAGLRF
jgi:hypothetical protein